MAANVGRENLGSYSRLHNEDSVSELEDRDGLGEARSSVEFEFVEETAAKIDSFAFVKDENDVPLVQKYLTATNPQEKAEVLQEFKNNHHFTKQDVKKELKEALSSGAAGTLTSKQEKVLKKELKELYDTTHGTEQMNRVTKMTYVVAAAYILLGLLACGTGIAALASGVGAGIGGLGFGIGAVLFLKAGLLLGLDYFVPDPEVAEKKNAIQKFETNISRLKDADQRTTAAEKEGLDDKITDLKEIVKGLPKIDKNTPQEMAEAITKKRQELAKLLDIQGKIKAIRKDITKLTHDNRLVEDGDKPEPDAAARDETYKAVAGLDERLEEVEKALGITPKPTVSPGIGEATPPSADTKTSILTQLNVLAPERGVYGLHDEYSKLQNTPVDKADFYDTLRESIKQMTPDQVNDLIGVCGGTEEAFLKKIEDRFAFATEIPVRMGPMIYKKANVPETDFPGWAQGFNFELNTRPDAASSGPTRSSAATATAAPATDSEPATKRPRGLRPPSASGKFRPPSGGFTPMGGLD